MPTRRLLPLLLPLALALPAAAQQREFLAARDTTVLAAGPQYRASGLHRFLFGKRYRELWTTPIRVPVVDLRRFDGGLRLEERGGGMQTKSLRFKSVRGREWVFRTVDKDPSSLLPRRLHGTVVDRVFQDQISSAHPAGALVVPPLLDAVGILHATPRLVVMPDDPRLGEHRRDFAGQLGIFEEYPNEAEGDVPGFAGADKVIGSDELLEQLNEDPDERVDARAFLTARLVDFLINDWDRHEDQWRWARMKDPDETGGKVLWIPIPRDRDQAFVWFDGFLPSLARFAYPKLVPFDATFPSLAGLTLNSRDLDRRLLAELERPVWDSVTAFVQRRITDSVIDDAVRRMPPEYHAKALGDLAGKLKRRRDALHEISGRFYKLLSQAVDVHATDAEDLAEVDRLADGSVEVRLFAASERPPPRRGEEVVTRRTGGAKAETAQAYAEPAGARGTHGGGREPYFRRRFLRDETREVRIYLHAGDDRAVIRGEPERSITVRVVGGKGEDEVADSSRVNGRPRPTRVYDLGVAGPEFDPDSLYGPDTLFDRRPWYAKDADTLEPPGRDFGRSQRPHLHLSYDGDLGLIAGTGFAFERYGFRHWPHARRFAADLSYATGPNAFRFLAEADFRREASRWGWLVRAQVPEFGVVRFYGFGNETPAGDVHEFYRVTQEQYAVAPALVYHLRHDGFVRAGPVVQYSTGPSNEGRFIDAARPYGYGNFGQVGVRAEVEVNYSHYWALAARGVRLRAGASLFPPLWDVDRTFGEVHAEAGYNLPLRVPLRPVLAVRAGGKKLWGPYPYHEAAFIGGSSTVRGLRENRFAGDASLYGSAELRVRLAALSLVLPADVGVFGLADAGRVFVDGEASRRWHSAFGGGLWLSFLDPGNTISVALASGEEKTSLYVRAGFAF